MFAPSAAVSIFPKGSDLILHFAAFTLMALTARLALLRWPRWWLWAVLLVLAVVLESLQSVVQPSRQFSYADMAANGAGVVAALVVWWGWLRVREVRSG